jgi:hypothetical protein
MPANGQFAHVLERARQDRDDVAQRAQAQADLAAIGARDADDNELTAEQHAARRGHVAWSCRTGSMSPPTARSTTTTCST